MNIPERFIGLVRKRLEDVPVKLGSLASDLGLEVFKSALAPGVSGLIEPSDTASSGYRIKINRYENTERQRFTLAHEIAHFLLHRQDIRGGVVDDAMYRSALSDRKEVEANKLASILIMPDDKVVEARRALAGIPIEEQAARLAVQFRVSLPAMRIKLGL